MITVGLDFGTHQTKVCIENKQGVECRYSFMKHKDADGKTQYTLPSVISIGHDGKLSYGYVSPKPEDEIVRYFKQAAFRTIPDMKMSQEDAMYYSCWYIASILFDLEEIYGQDFAIQMGAPTDSEHYAKTKEVAVRILASAYKLVEDVFHNDKKAFLNTDIGQLKKMTTLVRYSQELKDEYSILVFPEAYACLRPLTSKGKIPRYMNLMIDIGGGTTDISFFTIARKEGGKEKEMVPMVYDFHSIDMGLNFLTNALQKEKGNSIQESIDNTTAQHKGLLHSFGELFSHHHKGVSQQSNERIEFGAEIDPDRRAQFVKEVNKYVSGLIRRLHNVYKKQSTFDVMRLEDALKNRPLIYCGGGSTFKALQLDYSCFKDKKMITHFDWDIKSVDDVKEIVDRRLVPILSTSYGLAISVVNDDIPQKSFADLFDYLLKIDKKNRKGGVWDDGGYDSETNLYNDWDVIK